MLLVLGGAWAWWAGGRAETDDAQVEQDLALSRALVEALWWDLADRTPDPLEPLALSEALAQEQRQEGQGRRCEQDLQE